MTNEEKQLLLKDLCGRLPYGVMYATEYGPRIINDLFIYSNGPVYTDHGIGDYNEVYGIELENVKPYLRPMSRMTAEKEYEYHQCKNIDCLEICEMEHAEMLKTTALLFSRAIDFLNTHHFDYRGLIPMGLAIEAPEGMYKID